MALLLLLLSGRRCCLYGGCGLRLGLRRTPVPAASLYWALRPPEPPPWPALRLPECHFSSKADSKKLTSVLVSKVKNLNKKYERCLERTFPRFYQLYSTFLKDYSQLRQQMLYLCRKVQEGFHPDVTELKAVRPLFVGHPFGIQQLPVQHVKVLSRVLFLTPRLPSFFLRNRLRSHLSELYCLDQAMVKLGVSELTDEEVQAACYTRGLNSVHLSPSACRLWLNQWLSLSSSLRGLTGSGPFWTIECVLHIDCWLNQKGEYSFFTD
ncbi:LETM1 domain-containing protein 1 isoform X3 [Candoia aspera]|uniref:LETM1 domain-containing protein 1 isoform X3 n=1 Tax=Candoia aspera TaxID=51853 RepID=UPI002FD8797F